MPRKKRGAGRRKGKAAAAKKKPATNQQPVPDPVIVEDTPADDELPEDEVDEVAVIQEEDKEMEMEQEEQAEDKEMEQAEDGVGVEEMEPPPEEPEASSAEVPPATVVTEESTSDDKMESTMQEFWINLQSDESYLVQADRGYGPLENLKQPLKCFTSEDELQLFPVIESMSAKLYSTVQRMTADQKRDVEAAVKLKKGVVKFPNISCKAFICKGSVCMEAQPESSLGTKRAPHPFLLTEDENVFTEDKLKQLRAVLDAGWKREVVMRSPGSTGRKTGDVYYYSPDGTKFRSSKQVAQYLGEVRGTGFSLQNFSFAKARISTNPDQEIVRKAYDGKTPPRSPPKATTSRSTPSTSSKATTSRPGPKASGHSSREEMDLPRNEEVPVKVVTSRRSIQPPKRYSGDTVLLLSSKRPKMQDDKQRNSNSNKGLMQMGMLPPKYPKGMEDTSSNLSEIMDYNDTSSNHEDGSGSTSVAMKEIAEDSLFAISALRQSGGIDVEKMHQYVENQKKLAVKATTTRGRINGPPPPRPAAVKKGGHSAVIPCSIRCPGMTGVIPNLQCTRCLCLFHAECLGLPPNLMINKYLCSNCTDQGSAPPPAAAGSSSSQRPMLKKVSDIRRGPPGLSPLSHGHPRAPVSSRDVTLTVAAKGHLSAPPPQRMVSTSSGMIRGIVRPRGGSAGPHIRTPGHRMIAADGPHSMPMASGSAPMMRRGRGRPTGMMLPTPRSVPQGGRNLTITQLPRIHGPPPVPNLQPMSTPKTIPTKLPLPPMTGVKPRPTIAVPHLMKPNAFRVAVPPPSLSGRTFKKMSPVVSQSTPAPSTLRLSHAQMSALSRTPPGVYTTVPDRSIAMVKRSPQTVCVVGNKKFVVLPKKARDFISSPVGNGNTKRINDNQVVGGYVENQTTQISNESDGNVAATDESNVSNEMNPSNEQTLSYNDCSDQNSEEQGNGNNNVDSGESMETEGTLTEVATASAN